MLWEFGTNNSLLRIWEFVNGFAWQSFKWSGSFAERYLIYLAEKGVCPVV